MSAREAILAAVRRAAVPAHELVDISYFTGRSAAEASGAPPGRASASPAPARGADGAELVRRFSKMLEQVGGRAVELRGAGELAAAVAGLPAARLALESAAPRGSTEGRGVVSCVPGLPISTLVIGPDASRARLDQVELAIVPGRFGVAENAAVWVSEDDLPHRALLFVAQHLAIVLPRGEIVADMHAAYRRLRPPLPGYGVFISGPSKTADIEQALVIGAQGPKSLTVFLT